MRRYVGYALITIAILTGIVWGVSQFVQPILPAYFNNNLILVLGILIGVVGLLAQLKDVVELFKPDAKSVPQNKQRNEFSITGPVQINYGNVTNITLNVTYLISSQDKDFLSISETKTDSKSQEKAFPVPRQTPPLPREFVGRYQEITALKRILLTQSKTVTVTGLIGMGGIGKTTLANAIARDLEIEGAFHDGTLWTSLYDSSDVQEILIRWIRALGYEGNVDNMNENMLLNLFRHINKDRRLLLVVDGADQDRRADPYRFLKMLESSISPKSRMLVTSREINLPGVQTLVSLDLLPENESKKLLEKTAGRNFVNDEKIIVGEIVFLLGYHPLAISLAGGLLRANQNMTLEEIRDQLKVQLKTAKDMSLDNIRRVSIKKALDRTYKTLLTPSEQSKLLALSVFAGDASFDQNAASYVWDVSNQVGKRTLDKFSSLGLLAFKNERYVLHSLIQAYINDLVAKETRKKLLEKAQQGYLQYLKIQNAKKRK